MTSTQFHGAVDTPVGRLVLTQQNQAIIRVGWSNQKADHATPLLEDAIDQINQYFAGQRKQFQIPLDYQCGEFQKSACEQMDQIAYGETLTYGELAKLLNTSAQAVGNACGGNPFPLIIPCHRVLGSKGLGGYSGNGGIETKLELLKHEATIPWLI